MVMVLAVSCVVQCSAVQCLLILREMLLDNINYTPDYVLYSICFSVMKMELINQTFHSETYFDNFSF